MKNKEKGNTKSKGDGHARQSSGTSSSMEMQEINIGMCGVIDILVLDNVTTHVGVNMLGSLLATICSRSYIRVQKTE